MQTKNLRQIPSDKQYTADKQYSDLLYGYLQNISEFEPETRMRYIKKKDVAFTRFAEALGISRQTASTRFKALLDKDLISFNEQKKRYEITTLDRELATLLPNDTVRIVCNTLKERTLSILVYLINWYYAHDQQLPCDINIDLIKLFVGLTVEHRNNNQIIIDSLTVLQQLGFIQFHTEHRKDEATGCLKMYYVLDNIKTDVVFDNTILDEC